MRKNITSLHILFFLILSVCSCTSKTELNKNDIEAIQNLDKNYVELSVKHDWEKLSSLLTPEGILFPPNDTNIIGQSSNLKRFKGFGNLPIEYSHQLTTIEGNENLAYLHGNYAIKIILPGDAAPFIDTGKYLWILRKQPNKNWKIHRVMWNSSVSSKVGT